MSAHRNRFAAAVIGVFILVVAGAILAAASGGIAAHRAGPALPDYGALTDFSLTDHRGEAVSLVGFSGRVWIANFIFTRCAGQCPLMSQQMATLQETFAGLPGVRLVSFSVDPSHDTPEVLETYARRYGAQAGRWQFVTGEALAIHELAQKGFHLAVAEGGTTIEPMTHSVRFVLVDPQGHVRGYYDATDTEAMTSLARDARRLLQEVGG